MLNIVFCKKLNHLFFIKKGLVLVILIICWSLSDLLSFWCHVCLVVLNSLPHHVEVTPWVITGHDKVFGPTAFHNLSQSKTKFLAVLPNKLSEVPAD